MKNFANLKVECLHHTGNSLILGLMVGLMFVVFSFQEIHAQSAKEIVVTERFENVSLLEAINRLEKKYDIEFSYLSSTLKGVRVSSTADRRSLDVFLTELLKGSPVSHRFVAGRVLLYDNKQGELGQSKRLTISGFVTNYENGESLVGANIYVPRFSRGDATNDYGFYSMTFSTTEDSVLLVYSYVGFRKEGRWVPTARDTAINVSLAPSIEMEGIEVVGNPEESVERKTRMSRINVSAGQISKTPTLLGEPDVLKTLQILPGVHAGNEGLGGLNVRGSSPNHNLILLDGVTVYNANHIFGFVSVFNNNAIRNVEFVKGGFPARYGGRLASVVDIDMKEGNKKHFGGVASLGLLTSQLTLEGPISEGKTSFLISGRRSYADLLARPFLDDTDLSYYFYDLNAKINHQFSDNHRVFLSAYRGRDHYFRSQDSFKTRTNNTNLFGNDRILTTINSSDNSTGLEWGNLTSSLRWNALLNDQLFGNLTLTYSRYGFDFDLENRSLDAQVIKTPSQEVVDSTARREVNDIMFGSGIRDWSGRIDFDYSPSINHLVKFGIQGFHHRFSPQTVELVQFQNQNSSVDTTLGAVQDINAREAAAWLEDTWQLSDNFSLNAGVHASGFWVRDDFFYDILPRLSMRYALRGDWVLKASFASTKQYIHLLTNNSTALPTDLWLPSTELGKPEKAQQVALGFEKSVGDQFQLTVESYYKKMENLISYKEGTQSLTLEEEFESKLESGGRGKAAGIEVMLEKSGERLSGFMAYTLSKSDRTFENINQGETFPFKYDRRHDFALSLFYDIDEHIELSANWIYYTGQAVTIEQFEYLGIRNVINTPTFERERIGSFSDRNSVRMRSTHRLDFALHFTKENDWGERTLSVGLYNTYARKNPFFLFTDKEFESTLIDRQGSTIFRSKKVVKEVSLLRLLPMISYKIDF